MTNALASVAYWSDLLTPMDPRIQVDAVPAWDYKPRDLCGYWDCSGDAEVIWTPAKSTRHTTARVNRWHLAGWLSGLLLPTCGDPDVYDEPVIVRIGGAE